MGQIDKEMNVVMENPTDENIHAVYFDLMEEMQWSHRHVSDRSSEYEVYLESCNDKLISLSNGEHAGITTTQNNEQNVNINSPFFMACRRSFYLISLFFQIPQVRPHYTRE